MVQVQRRAAILEAFMMSPERRASNAEWPQWMHEAWNSSVHKPGALSCVDFPNSDGTDHLQVTQRDGSRKRIEWGDWLVRHTSGMIGVYTNAEFERDYVVIARGPAPGHNRGADHARVRDEAPAG